MSGRVGGEIASAAMRAFSLPVALSTISAISARRLRVIAHVRRALLARRHQAGLRAQDHAVGQHLEMIGAQRRAGRGDVDNHVGRAGGRRAFRGAQALDDAIDLDAVLAARRTAGSAASIWWRCAAGGRGAGGNRRRHRRGRPWCRRRARCPARRPPHRRGRSRAGPAISALLSQSAIVLAQKILAGDAEIDAPCPISPAISEADRKAISMSPRPSMRARYLRSSPGRLTPARPWRRFPAPAP